MNRITARDRVGDFDKNSPRPPVPGEETEPCCQEYHPVFSPAQNFYRCTPRVPACSIAYSAALLEGKAPLGFEPEGSCSNNDNGSRSPSHEGTRSPPPYLQWAKNLDFLLQDPEGVELFKTYLKGEGQNHVDALDFWFACEGFKKKREGEEFHRLGKVIFRKYVCSPVLKIREDLRNEVGLQMKLQIHPKLFDQVQVEVVNRISATTYPNFLVSDIYLDYVRKAQSQQDYSPPYNASSGSSSSSREFDFGGPAYLPTVHENEVLNVMPEPSLPLTRDSLVATETRRILDVRPKPEAFAGVYLKQGLPVNNRIYSSYNPVSRQDSELQSLSSDARTDSDAMSCTDNSVDGSAHHQRSKRHQQQKYQRAMRENAAINGDTKDQPMIPKQYDRPLTNFPPPSNTMEFARVLTEKLEAWLRKEKENENFYRRMKDDEKQKNLAEILHDKMGGFEDQDNQAILDEHCQRVWSDLTPCRSPPDPRRKMLSQSVPHPYQVKSTCSAKYPKKEKDVYSTFSADSGNIHDFPDNPECNRQFPKSRSFPEHVDTQNTMSSFEARHRSGKNNGFGRLSSNKKTLSTEFTDSGVSEISDTIPCSSKHGNEWQMSRLKESSSSKHRSLKQPSSMGAAVGSSVSSSVSHRHGRKSERSGSLERCMQNMHMSDPTVIQMSSGRPNTASQLEEARRKLEDDNNQKKMLRQRLSTSNKAQGQSQMPDLSLSNQSTLRKPVKKSEPSPPVQLQQRSNEEFMTVTYSFWDEEVPYRTKVASKEITLKQFKDLLPRKGNYRYFFKTKDVDCEDMEPKAVHEEVFDDNQILPLWEGKLVAQVKPY